MTDEQWKRLRKMNARERIALAQEALRRVRVDHRVEAEALVLLHSSLIQSSLVRRFFPPTQPGGKSICCPKLVAFGVLGPKDTRAAFALSRTL